MCADSPCGRPRVAEGWPQIVSAKEKSPGSTLDKPAVELNTKSWQVNLLKQHGQLDPQGKHSYFQHTEDNKNTAGLLQKMLVDYKPPRSSCMLQRIISDTSVTQIS